MFEQLPRQLTCHLSDCFDGFDALPHERNERDKPYLWWTKESDAPGFSSTTDADMPDMS